ncbi:MAG: hypothetical protein ACPG4T_06645 [Nannocystaceae bacterium]
MLQPRHLPIVLTTLLSAACTPDIPDYSGFWDDVERERCGNGIIDYHSEECDRGDDNAADGFCSTTCKKATCGDGVIQLDEECDLGDENADNGNCTRRCYSPRCGDGFVQPGEACDLGENNSAASYGNDGCSLACEPLPHCGDGLVEPGIEDCDDGNDDNTDACTSECKPAVCGDGIVFAGQETCDDGNDDNTDACLNSCDAATCGDNFVQEGVEECDGTANCNEACIRDRIVFVTAETWDGDFKGGGENPGIQGGADSICRSRAIIAGIKGEADVLAWLSDDETSPAQRFFHSPGRYVLLDGTVVADSWDDLTDGMLANPIMLTETLEVPSANNAWSNTNPDGTPASQDSCENWSNKDSDLKSILGIMVNTDSEWTDIDFPIGCDAISHLYCFEQQ